MASTGIEPPRLELEVTETAMMQDRDRAAAILKQLSDMGISVAVDDFGTGYSNLSYLIDFSFHKLKIDRSFVSRMDTDASSGAVVSTIVGLSRALGVAHHRRGRRDGEPGRRCCRRPAAKWFRAICSAAGPLTLEPASHVRIRRRPRARVASLH